MLKYKTLVVPPLILIGMVIITLLLKLAGDGPGYFIAECIDWVNSALQLFCIFTLTIVLRRHNESIFRALPFYLLILMIAALAVFNNTISGKLLVDETFTTVKTALTMILGLSGLAFIITNFTVKNPAIKTYFRLYGMSWICTAIILAALKNAFAGNDIWYTYQYYVSNMLVMLPVVVIFYIHYSLYTRHEVFDAGDLIIIKRNLENLFTGTQGTVIKKHRNSNYYEVEFLDTNGALLNVLQISGDDMEHISEPGLDARINSFGKAV